MVEMIADMLRNSFRGKNRFLSPGLARTVFLVLCRSSKLLAALAATTVLGCSPAVRPASSGTETQAAGEADKPARDNEDAGPDELPMPSELKSRIRQAEVLGAAMFALDSGTARAQDVLAVHLGVSLEEPLPGVLSWVTVLDGDQVQVDFVGGTAETPVTLYRSLSPVGAGSPKIEAIDPPEPLSTTASAQFWAMQTVSKQRFRPCSFAYNPIVVPGSLGGEEGWLVYMMAASTNPNEAYLIGHHRFLVSSDGKSVLRHEPLSLECMIHEWEAGAVPTQFHLSHLVSDVPGEAYVFANLLYGKPITVLAVHRQEVWIVYGGRYHYYGDIKRFSRAASSPEPEAPKASDPMQPKDCPGSQTLSATVSGTVYEHCSYGPPGYGEDPQQDGKELSQVLVLDTPIEKLSFKGVGDYVVCLENVRAFHLSRYSSNAPGEQIGGRRIKVSVNKVFEAHTGHHQTRAVLSYDQVLESEPAKQSSLRKIWPTIKDDMRGAPCAGYPR